MYLVFHECELFVDCFCGDFFCVLEDNGAVNAASRAVAALVFGVVVGFSTHGRWLLNDCGFRHCVMATGLSDVVGDAAFDRAFLLFLPGVDSGTLRSVSL